MDIPNPRSGIAEAIVTYDYLMKAISRVYVIGDNHDETLTQLIKQAIKQSSDPIDTQILKDYLHFITAVTKDMEDPK